MRVLIGCLFLLLFLALESGVVLAQDTSAEISEREYVFTEWDNTKGLPVNAVTSIVQDEKGYIWAATEAGLVRFNGREFVTYNAVNTPDLPTSWVHDVIGSEEGGIWASTANSLIGVENRQLTVYDLRNYIEDIRQITSIEEDENGNVWVGTNTGSLYIFNGSELLEPAGWKEDEAGSVNTLKRASGGIMIGTDRGLWRYLHSSGETEPVPGIRDVNVRTVTESPEGVFWAGTMEHGLFKLSGDDVKRYGSDEGLSDDFINTLMPAEDGRLWVGTGTSGIQFLENDRITTFSETEERYTEIRHMYAGSENETWVSSAEYGLVLISEGNVENITSEQGLSSDVILAVYQHENGEIWAGTAGAGVNRIRDGEITQYGQQDGLAQDIVLGIYGTGEYIYISTSMGLSRFNLNLDRIDQNFTTDEGLANNTVFAVYPDTRGRLWVTSREGGIHYMEEDSTFSRLELSAEFEHADFINVFEDRHQNLWFGSTSMGMVQLEASGKVREYHLGEQYPVEVILDFFEDPEGDLWIATDIGLLLKQNEEFKLFDVSHGFHSNTIYRMVSDGENLWLSGTNGIQLIAISELMKLKSEENPHEKAIVELFDRSDGMLNQEANGGVFPAGWKMNDGKIWFPTMQGLAIFTPSELTGQDQQLPLLIEHLRFGDRQLELSDDPRLPAGTQNIEIKFTGFDFTKPQTINYFYRMAEENDEWQPAGNRNTAYFTSIEPGHHTFEVKADQFGVESDVASLNFYIEPFFYQTIGFRILIVISLFVAGFMVKSFHSKVVTGKMLRKQVDDQTKELRERNRKMKEVMSELEKQNELLKKVAWMQSHELRGPLSRMLGLLEVVKNYDSYKKVEKSREQLVIEIEEAAVELDNIIRKIILEIDELDQPKAK